MQTLRYAVRFLLRKKAFTAINILGLALSLACSIILGRYLYREVTVDRHAIDPESIYISFRHSDVHGSVEMDIESLKDQYDDEGRAYIDQLYTDYSSFLRIPGQAVKMFDRERTANMIIVDSVYTHFFSYDIEGDAEALKKEDACWVSDAFLTLCGLTKDDALGESIELKGKKMKIAGIFHKPDYQVIYDPDMIVPRYLFDIQEFGAMPVGVFRVRPDFDATEVAKKLSTFGEPEQHWYEWMDNCLGYQFVSWSDYYFYPCNNNIGESQRQMYYHGNASVCWILLAVMILILVVGIVNFINLYIVYCQRRALESGVRRVFGRQTRQLFFELWSELMILTLAAVFAAWLFVELATPFVEQMLGNTNAGTSFDILVSVGIIIVLPLLAAVYPFVQQFRYSPSTILRQKTGTVQSIKARTVILGFQYFISITLVVVSLWMGRHLDFLLNSPVGFDADRVLLVRPVHYTYTYGFDKDGNYFDYDNREDVTTILTAYVKALKESSLVEKYCFTRQAYLPFSIAGDIVYYNNKGEECKLKRFDVTPMWFEIFGVKMQEGAMPNPELTTLFEHTDDGGIEGWLANRMAMKRLGYQTLEGAYARSKDPIFIYGDNDGIHFRGNEAYPIMGIVSDHYSGHRTLGASAAVYFVDKDDIIEAWNKDSYIAIRFRPEEKEALYSFIMNLQEKVCPNQALETRWLSDMVAEQYKNDRLMADVYRLFSAIAVVICCLGLLGLSLFDIRQRYKEIAIRKANGAHRKDLYLLLGKKYLFVMLIAFVLSIPVTYLFIHNYTESFVESAPVSPFLYIEALGIILLLTMLTLVYHLENAARVNVASVVKTE